jgi:maltose O-acetyltransferase
MHIHPWLQVDNSAHIGKIHSKRGRKSFIGWGCYIADNVHIGEGVMIAPNVTIVTSTHPIQKGISIRDQKTIYKSVYIGNHVLIGAGAVILAGNIIKDHAVIGAGAVLTEDHIVNSNEVWAGNPAKRIKKR